MMPIVKDNRLPHITTLQCYSVHCEGELLGLCWEFPRLTCYGKYFLRMWQVHNFESHFASFESDVVKIVRVDGPPPTLSNLRVAKILAVTDVRLSMNYPLVYGSNSFLL